MRKPQGIEKEIMNWANDPLSDVNRGVLINQDREFFEEHYAAIAERLMQKRLWRGPWSVEVNGCVFKFTVKGYAKKGSEIWREQQREIADAVAESEIPVGD